MVDYFHKNFHPWDKPRTYRREARKEYLALAKSKKRTEKKIRATIRKQLGYVRRDLEYLENYMEEGYVLPPKYTGYYLTIQKLYEQQKYMYDNRTHSVENRIVSISQPYLWPIVRGKAKIPVEFGVNQLYQTRENRNFCRDHNITMSGSKLGRPSKNKKSTKEEYQDNVDRIEVERFFSSGKRCNGAGLIMTKLEETILSSIAMSILVTNLFAVDLSGIFLLYFSDNISSENKEHYIIIDDAA